MAGNYGEAEYSQISKWLHFGRSVNTGYSGQCISAVIVVDYLYRQVVVPLLSAEFVRIEADPTLKEGYKSKLLKENKQNRQRMITVPHPLSVVFSSMSLKLMEWSKQDYSTMEDAYETMCTYLLDKISVPKIDEWVTYRYKFRKGCYILGLFTRCCVNCENMEVKSSPIQYAAENWKVAEHLTSMFSKKTCTNNSVSEMITMKSIDDVLSPQLNAGQDNSTINGSTKNSFKNKTALNQDIRRRQKRLRGLLQQPNEQHQEEDNYLAEQSNKNKELASIETTDSQNVTDESVNFTAGTGSTLPPLFSGLSQPYMGRIHYPFIVVETFRDNETGNVVKGDLEQGLNSKTIYRESVLGVETTNSYCYYFKRADLKPHMVVDAQQAKTHLEAAQNNRVTTTIVYSNSLKKEFKLPHSEFMFWSELTTEYQQCFGKEKLKFDLDFWHIKFDSDHSEDNLNRGFTEYFDGGYGRDGVMENTYRTQQRGKEYVSALPSLINDTSLYFHFGGLMDCIQDMADMNVRDEGKLL